VRIALLAVVIAAAAAARPDVRLLETPASSDSGFYSLAASPTGRVYLSWVESVVGGAHALKFATLGAGRWSAPRTIASGTNWFVNWADHPSVAAFGDTLMAHWLVHNEERSGTYGYRVRIAASRDGGERWTPVFEAGAGNVADYTGFVSFLAESHGGIAAYLTPPETPGTAAPHEHTADHVMTLRAVAFGADGTRAADTLIDPDTCTCCNTATAETDVGPVIVYRDHLPGEVRDIAIVRRVDGHWTAPRPVFNDHWTINACPTNGPAIAARGKQVVVAWFTAANDRPRLKLAFSNDAGAQFAAPLIVDDARPVGWPRTVLLEDGSAVVSWLTTTADGAGEFRVRRIWRDGRIGMPVVVATTTSGRSAGQPQMVRTVGSLVVAWRQDGRVRTALLPIPAR